MACIIIFFIYVYYVFLIMYCSWCLINYVIFRVIDLYIRTISWHSWYHPWRNRTDIASTFHLITYIYMFSISCVVNTKCWSRQSLQYLPWKAFKLLNQWISVYKSWPTNRIYFLYENISAENGELFEILNDDIFFSYKMELWPTWTKPERRRLFQNCCVFFTKNGYPYWLLQNGY